MTCGKMCDQYEEEDWKRWLEADEHIHPVICFDCCKQLIERYGRKIMRHNIPDALYDPNQ